MIIQEKLEQIAKCCHELNRAYCETMGDNTQPSWENAPDWQKKSAIAGVKAHWAKLSTGFEPNPAESHENWMQHKLKDGWKYGPVKDPEKKEHPCMVSYEDLPPEQKIKDSLFIGVVKSHYSSNEELNEVAFKTKCSTAGVYPSMKGVCKTDDYYIWHFPVFGGIDDEKQELQETQELLDATTPNVLQLEFFKRNENGTFRPGILDEQLVQVILARQAYFAQGPYASEESDKAIAGLNMFLEAQRERAEKRMKRNVFGKLKK